MADPLKDKRIWITGASSGIGRAVAIEFARRGATLIVSGRDVEKLSEVVTACGAERAGWLAYDVTDRDANRNAAQEVAERLGGLDIVFLNAGYCEYVDARRFDSSLFERQIRINYLAMVYGVEATLPLLRQSKRPQIIGMSSASVYGGLPRAEAYGASKVAAKYFLESLRVDLLSEGIRVSVVCPGFVRTPLTDLNDFPMPLLLEPEDAARRIVNGVEKGTAEIHFPKRFTWTFKLLSLLPEPLYSRLIERLTRTKGDAETGNG